MSIKLFQVDSFAEGLFTGNPAAVCPLDEWISDELMQKIAGENNLSETAFFVHSEDPLHIRWFTPSTEVELCGHATLATAHVLRKHLNYPAAAMMFESQSGPLGATDRENDMYTLDFPVDILRPIPDDLHWKQYFSQPIVEGYRGVTDYIFRLASEQSLRDVTANFGALREADGRGFILTAEGTGCDYVSRCFYPQAGIDEDPATGSSQTTLATFWESKLKKSSFSARQLSARGASFTTELVEDRVLITGKAITYLTGEISI